MCLKSNKLLIYDIYYLVIISLQTCLQILLFITAINNVDNNYVDINRKKLYFILV